METPKSLRERAEHWRVLAYHQSHGTADALLEAACDLEMRARHLETASSAAFRNPEPAPAAEPPRRSWRLMPRRSRDAA